MKSYQNKYLHYIILLPVALLAACSHDINDLEAFVSDIKIHASGSIDKIPEQHPYQPFSYPKHNKDPFDGSALQPKMVKKVIQGVQINPKHRLQFLENFSLESMKMVGIIQYPNIIWAVIRSSDDKVHRVKIGDYIGTNHGKITDISATKINIVELIPNETGAFTPRNNFIHLEQNQHDRDIESSEHSITKETSVD
jgi:type IV pilus assembly protein PilP